MEASVLIVPPDPVTKIPLLVPRANELVDWIVPLFKIILSLSAVPGVAPKLAELDTTTLSLIHI